MVSPVVRPTAAALLCLVPLAASAQNAPEVREDLAAVGAALDRAVEKVSRPGARVFPLGGSATRAYVLPGVGAVFVLAPRALPPPRRRPADEQTARAVADAVARLQDSLTHVNEPELRAQIERSLNVVREIEVELQGGPRRMPRLVWPPLPPPPEFTAEFEAAVAAQENAARDAERESRKMKRAFRDEWEARVQALSAQTDAFRREAELMQREAELALRDQLRAWPELEEAGLAALPAPPAAPAAPGAPAVPPLAAPPAAPAVPAPAAVPPAVAAPPVPAAPAAHPKPGALPVPPAMIAPPWTMWFEPDDVSDAVDADTLVGNVRTAVLGALAGQASRLSRLAADDSVVVAVDFVSRAALVSGSPRTLVLRVRKKDLEARQAGRLADEEFARRVETVQY